MESRNLQSASTYVNNILLARGLLKSGRAIDFAQPDNDEGGTEATMARVINLVNDLVLRRDVCTLPLRSCAALQLLIICSAKLSIGRTWPLRSAHFAQASQSRPWKLYANICLMSWILLTLVVTTPQGKLKMKTSELTRSLALGEAQERVLKSNMSSAEATIRELREQVQRMKTTVQQVRTQCANDIRKRDLELQKLKSHLAERQRGKREGLSVTTININPSVDRSRLLASGGERVNDPGYSLKQETTEFLTELCQNLSNENDTLIELARNTVQTLNELQGLPHLENGSGEEDLPGMGDSGGMTKSHSGPVTALPTTCEELSTQMDTVLEHLQTLLTNPSFVPLEEVEVRDEEIKQLRKGWEKMENRWKQAVTMMDGWQRRLADGGDSVQMEELKRGLSFDLTLDLAEDVDMPNRNETNTISPVLEDQQEEDKSDTEDPRPESEPPNPSQVRSKVRKVTERPERALKERSDNARPKRLARKVAFTSGLQESPREPNEEETMPVKAHDSNAVTRRPSKRKTETRSSRQVSLPKKRRLR